MTDSELLVCRAAAQDAEAILALQKRAYASEARLYDDWSIPPLVQSLESMREELQSMHVLKAVAGEALVGSVRARVQDGVGHIGRLIVEPQRQGRGIGSALLRAIEELLDCTQFELFTGSRSEGNIRLYRRHGYEVIGTQTLSAQVTFTLMRKRTRGAPSIKS